ncbi:hypothetical protein G9A89_005670 [Geosiphon pyriformis]|nr:hypothetical protein G9A89_005670 [Geosiphon pyriformis]
MLTDYNITEIKYFEKPVKNFISRDIPHFGNFMTIVDRQFFESPVVDPIILNSLIQSASFASQAACLTGIKYKMAHNLWAQIFINSKSNPKLDLSREVIVVIKSSEYQYKAWKTREKKFTKYVEGNVDFNFYKKWKKASTKFFEMWNEFKLQNLSQNVIYKMRFIGFGIGGVYAVFAALDFPQPQGEKHKVITFGQPRMGDHQFVTYVWQRLWIYRVTYANDLIPSFPKGEYRHLSKEYWIPESNYCDCQSHIVNLIECFPNSNLEENPVKNV